MIAGARRSNASLYIMHFIKARPIVRQGVVSPGSSTFQPDSIAAEQRSVSSKQTKLIKTYCAAGQQLVLL